MIYFDHLSLFFFVFNDTSTTESYTYGHTLSLHDALPISIRCTRARAGCWASGCAQGIGCAYLCRICSFNLVAGRSGGRGIWRVLDIRSEEHTSELQSLMRISYAVFCLKKKNNNNTS